jgi:hypothetical protein
MQLQYNINMGVANPGMIADAAFDMIESFQAYEVLDIGLGIVKRVGMDYVGRLPKANASEVTVSADLVAGDIVNMSINGTALTATTYAVSHVAAMNAVIAKLLALTTIVATAALDPADVTNRTILITSLDGLDCIVIASITNGGMGTATASVITSSTDTLEGVSVSTMAKEETLGTLLVQFKVGEAIPTMRKGKIYVFPEVNVASGDPVYCRFLGNGTTKFSGHFRNDGDSGTAFLVDRAMFKTTATAGSPAIVEINLP